jgi:hypothetical protein
VPGGHRRGGAGRAAGRARPGEVLVRLETPFGTIDLAIDEKRAPVTAANFLKYVDGGFYDGGRFHRATRPDNYTPAPPNRPMLQVVQAGINPHPPQRGLPGNPGREAVADPADPNHEGIAGPLSPGTPWRSVRPEGGETRGAACAIGDSARTDAPGTVHRR